jgi:hypothetical protein
LYVDGGNPKRRYIVSAKNGDRSRFGRLRKQKILRRQLNAKLRAEVAPKRDVAGSPDSVTVKR